MKYRVLDKEIIYSGFFKLEKAKVEFDTYTNNKLVYTFEYFIGNDAVTAVVLEKDTQHFIFVEQFRFALAKKTDAWFLENVAGLIDSNEKPDAAIQREIKEEIGYKASTVKPLFSYFSSPGGSAKKVFVYYVEVNSSDKIYKGGGLENESEDLKVVKIPIVKVKEMLLNNEIEDGKTILALQHFFLNETTKF